MLNQSISSRNVVLITCFVISISQGLEIPEVYCFAQIGLPVINTTLL